MGRRHSAWVCVRTEPHRENLAEQNLLRSDLDVYCPRYQRWVSSGRRKQLVLRPLFPNYLFVRSASGLDAMGHVKRTPGVSSLAARDLASAVVPDAIIDALRSRETDAGYFELGADRFQRGDVIRVTTGPFADFDAIFNERHDENRSSILLSFLGKQHSVVVLSEFLDSAA